MTDFNRDFHIVMPHIGPKWNLDEFLASAGDLGGLPFLLIDNSPDGQAKAMNLPIEVEAHPENLGTAMSWNLGIARGKKYTLILSVSTRFPPGGIKGYLERARHWVNDFGFYSPIGGHCHVIGFEMVNEIGLFDVSFRPAYAEDTDHGYRLTLSRIHPEGSIPVFHPVGLSIRGSAIAIQNNPQVDQRVAERELYYFQKWGGAQCKEIFTRPFNNPDNPLAYWPMPDIYEGKGYPEWNWKRHEVD